MVIEFLISNFLAGGFAPAHVSSNKIQVIMEIQMFHSTTIVMYDFGDILVCFSHNARTMFSIVGWSFGCHRDDSFLGDSFIMPSDKEFAIFPKVVRNGYKIAINPKEDCPHQVSI